MEKSYGEILWRNLVSSGFFVKLWSIVYMYHDVSCGCV